VKAVSTPLSAVDALTPVDPRMAVLVHGFQDTQLTTEVTLA
jgi:hypothetical protein